MRRSPGGHVLTKDGVPHVCRRRSSVVERCVVPVTGYMEFISPKGDTTAHLFTRSDGQTTPRNSHSTIVGRKWWAGPAWNLREIKWLHARCRTFRFH
jgi:hypothetical protein